MSRHVLLLLVVSATVGLPLRAGATPALGPGVAVTTKTALRTKRLRKKITAARRPARRLRSLVQLRTAPGLRVRRLSRAWGTALTVSRLQQVMDDYRRWAPSAQPIWIHDMSRRDGGPLPLHRSHREGRDVDIRLVLRRPAGYIAATPRTLHLDHMWFLLLRLISTCDVEFIMLDFELQRALYRRAVRLGLSSEALGLLLQYPIRRSHRHPDNGVVRHYPKHRNHMHVRFRRQGRPLEVNSATALCRPNLSGGPSLIRRTFVRFLERVGRAKPTRGAAAAQRLGGWGALRTPAP